MSESQKFKDPFPPQIDVETTSKTEREQDDFKVDCDADDSNDELGHRPVKLD